MIFLKKGLRTIRSYDILRKLQKNSRMRILTLVPKGFRGSLMHTEEEPKGEKI